MTQAPEHQTRIWTPDPLDRTRVPYHPGRPIDDRKGFFGRSTEIRTALSYLANLQSVSVVGPRRIGKTSLLHFISDPSVLEDYALDPKRFVFTFMNCAELSDLSRDRILQVILDQARTGLNRDRISG